MPQEIVMPRLGWDMERGILRQWLKQDGDQVQAGDVLFTVEGDKATQEVEALDSGTLRIPPDSPPPGTELPVGALIAYLVKPGELAPVQTGEPVAHEQRLPQNPGAREASTSGPPATARSGAHPRPGKGPASSPRARRVAAELGVGWTVLRGTGRGARIIERDVRKAAQAAHARVSPLARALAVEHGIDLDDLSSKLPGRRIERSDIEATLEGAPTTPKAGASQAATPLLPGQRVPVTQVRRTIASRMSTSAHTTAPVTLTTEADASELVQMRDRLRSSGEIPLPSYIDFLVKLVAQVLLTHLALNARWDGDAIFQASAVNMGIAVDTERGLLVPVIQNAHEKSVREIARESADMIARARQGRAKLEELEGGTFTLSNLGMYDIDAFTPIINLPECAVLGIGRIAPKQVVVDPRAGQVAIRQMMFLSLTFDHRLVDGAPAARFLQQVKGAVEHPATWFVGLR